MSVRVWLGALVVATPFLVGATAGGPGPRGEVVTVLRDPEVVESSGLALVDGLLATVNDSGDSGRVFAVDPATGETVGTTRWAPDPVDVEALAPAGPGEVWVADVGDNLRARDAVEVLRVPLGRRAQQVDPPRWRLTWPDGARDAEALVVHPRTGRLHLVSKGVLGGELVAAPAVLAADRPNPLEPLAPVAGLVTDGAFWPDGRHLLLRSYDRLHVYSYPAVEKVADLPLPPQPQGEGLAVTPDGHVWVSTEGVGSEVLRVRLPAGVRRALDGPPAAGPADGASDGASDGSSDEPGAGWWRRLLGWLLRPV
ncbi:hypothetical protein [Nocardioides solisilvae]|uniref:hypothetical protein n=1 Tax=Nocardioides solisilvae TaxID=1542435 RepID=UPI000D744CAE|nr:hypothetical protein [Nocardioides solisilvae]